MKTFSYKLLNTVSGILKKLVKYHIGAQEEVFSN